MKENLSVAISLACLIAVVVLFATHRSVSRDEVGEGIGIVAGGLLTLNERVAALEHGK